MSNSTKITFKRSTLNIKDDTQRTLAFGEPLLIDNTDEDYLVIGPAPNGNTIQQSIFFRGLTREQAEHQVTYVWGEDCKPAYKTEADIGVVTDLSFNPLKVKMVSSDSISSLPPTDASGNIESGPYYILCQDPNGKLRTFQLGDMGDIGIYIDNKGVMHGAAWNDYAENRHYEGTENIDELVGHVVCEDGKGNLVLSTERLQPCSYIVSNTYGMTIGEGNIHVAVSGKVPVIVSEPVELGDCVTAGANGKASKMSRQEIVNYPDRILGIVTKVSDEDEKVWVEIK